MTYNGLESCILNSHSYENESHTSRGDGCATDSLDEDDSSCSSSKDVFGSFSSKWLAINMKKDEHGLDEWEVPESPQHLYVKEKQSYSIQFSDVEVMKERFSKLLLGEDVSGGKKSITSALALSHAITNLAGVACIRLFSPFFSIAWFFIFCPYLYMKCYNGFAVSVFGELWKLEPLSEERKVKWQREMDWLLSPANYMVELVPATQSGANGRTMEVISCLYTFLSSLTKCHFKTFWDIILSP